VFTHLPQGGRGKLAALHAALRTQERVHDLTQANISTLSTVAPLRETAAVAEQVWQRYSASRSQPRPELIG
jgi:hypothetical protein